MPPLHLELRSDINVKPCFVKTARQVNIHHQEAARKRLEELLAAKVITMLSQEEHTKWISPAFFVEKPGTSPLKVRLITDYRQLNKAIKRQVYPFHPCHEPHQADRPGDPPCEFRLSPELARCWIVVALQAS